MAGFPVNVELEVLVLVEKAPTGFVHQEVVGIFLGNQVGIITMADGRPHFNHLTGNLNEKRRALCSKYSKKCPIS